VKAPWRQQDLEGIPNNPLDEIQYSLFFMKDKLKSSSKQAEANDRLLKEAAGLLDEAQTMLSDMGQEELFDDEGTETTGNVEYQNEVFEELKDLLGNKQAEKVADYFSGSLVYFSKGIAIARKHREIKKAFLEGTGYRELALKYEYTEQHIRRIVHGGGKSK
jgi:Mor family transcriptional regulator